MTQRVQPVRHNTRPQHAQQTNDQAVAAILRRYTESLKRRQVDGQADTKLERRRG